MRTCIRPQLRSFVADSPVSRPEERLSDAAVPLPGRLRQAPCDRPADVVPRTLVAAKRRVLRIGRTLRETRMFAKAMQSPLHPILAQLVVTRRCNLACAYCNEFDRTSSPVPTPEILRRIDRLAELGTTIITISGGEPMLHPDLDAIVAHIRKRGAIATLITNGLLLTEARIDRLNRAGLDYLQISIDNLAPDAVSKKSLSVLRRRLDWLAARALFQVTINSVVGDCIEHPDGALTIARLARELGFTSTVGIIHDHEGQLRPLDEARRIVVDRILHLSTSLFSFAHFDHFQQNIIRGLPNRWHCRAGCRFLYVCEDGLVHYCSQQRGRPGVPLATYGAKDLAREAARPKACAPLCTVSCVHQAAMLDSFRERPSQTLAEMMARRKQRDPSFEVPWLVRLLSWVFLTPSHREVVRRIALRVLGLGRAGSCLSAGVIERPSECKGPAKPLPGRSTAASDCRDVQAE